MRIRKFLAGLLSLALVIVAVFSVNLQMVKADGEGGGTPQTGLCLNVRDLGDKGTVSYQFFNGDTPIRASIGLIADNNNKFVPIDESANKVVVTLTPNEQKRATINGINAFNETRVSQSIDKADPGESGVITQVITDINSSWEITINAEFQDDNPGGSGGPGGPGGPGGSSPEPGNININIANNQNGVAYYKIDSGEWIEINGNPFTLRAGTELNGVAPGAKIYFKLVPNTDQSIDEHDNQNVIAINGTVNGIPVDSLKDGSYYIEYSSSAICQIDFAFENAGGPEGEDPPPPPGGTEGEETPHTYTIKVGTQIFENVQGGDVLKVAGGIADLEFWITKVDDFDLVNVGNKSTTTDLEGRNPLEIFAITEEDNIVTYNLTYHVEDDPANAGAPGFYIVNLSFIGEEFKGLEIQAGALPDMYDDTVYSDVVDINESTATNPVKKPVFYGSDTVDFAAFDVANPITKIAAGDGLNPNAITVTGTQVKINSPFYASIPLKVTLEDGTIGYVTLDRIGIEVGAYNAGQTTNHGSQPGCSLSDVTGADARNIVATFYYDASENYADYNMVAKLTFADGTTRTVVANGFDEKVCAGDASLIGGDYLIWSGDADEQPVSVSVTAVKAGATTSETFGGACFGAGQGVTKTFEK